MADIILNVVRRWRRVAAVFVCIVVAAMVCLPIDAATSASVKSKASVDSVEVKGRVLDEDGESLIGATVFIKNTNRGVLTDIDGEFSIKVPVGAELEVGYLCDFPQTFLIDRDTRNLDIILVRDEEAWNAACESFERCHAPMMHPGTIEPPKTIALVGESSDSIPSLQGLTNNKVKVRGHVRDSEGALIGTVIRNPAAGSAVFSKDNGEFEIDAISGSELVVSYLGYDTQYFKVGESSDSLMVTLNDIGFPIVDYSSYDTTNGWVILKVYGPDGKLMPSDQLYVCRVLDEADGKQLYYDIMNITESTDEKFVFPWVYLLPNVDSDVPEVATLDIHGVNCKTKRITIYRPKRKATLEVHL